MELSFTLSLEQALAVLCVIARSGSDEAISQRLLHFVRNKDCHASLAMTSKASIANHVNEYPFLGNLAPLRYNVYPPTWTF